MQRQHLYQLTMFKGLTDDQIDIIENFMDSCIYPENVQIFNQGDRSKYLYLLLDGEVAIQHKLYDGPKIKIAQIKPGGVFGWSSMLGRKKYTSEVITLFESETYRITKKNLHTMCNQYPVVGELFLERLAGVISKRLLNTHHEVLSILHRGIEVDIISSKVYK